MRKRRRRKRRRSHRAICAVAQLPTLRAARPACERTFRSARQAQGAHNRCNGCNPRCNVRCNRCNPRCNRCTLRCATASARHAAHGCQCRYVREKVPDEERERREAEESKLYVATCCAVLQHVVLKLARQSGAFAQHGRQDAAAWNMQPQYPKQCNSGNRSYCSQATVAYRCAPHVSAVSHAVMQRYKTTFEEIAMCAEFFCGRPVKTPERYIALRQADP